MRCRKCAGHREVADGSMAARYVWIRKVTRAQAHASARASTPTHSHARLSHARTLTPTLKHTNRNIHDIPFPRQQWFHERTSMLRYTYFACLVLIYLEKTSENLLDQLNYNLCHFINCSSCKTEIRHCQIFRECKWLTNST